MPSYDAVLILGGGVREGGTLPAWVAARFDRALELCGDSLLMPLSAGTPHRPPALDGRGFPIVEAKAGARYLMERGVDPARILIEGSSFDTIGNAYFSRVIHVIPRGFARVLVITSGFHMERAEAVFRWVYSFEAPGTPCAVDFAASPDRGVTSEDLAGRAKRERSSLEIVRRVQKRISSFSDFHRWLFTEHGVYSAGERPPGDNADPSLY